MPTTRCKFTVSEIRSTKSMRAAVDEKGEPQKDAGGHPVYEVWPQPTVSLTAVYDPEGKDNENHTFWTATPTGSISLGINNPLGAEIFEVGADYYVDFIKVDKED